MLDVVRSVVFAADAARAEQLAGVLRREGYDATIQLAGSAQWNPSAAHTCTLVFVDLSLAIEPVRELCTQIAASKTVLPPLIAIVGELTEELVDPLIAAGANMYFGNDLTALAYRTRFLLGAIRGRGQFSSILAELHASEERYRTVISAMEQGLIVRRTDGSVMTVNASAERILGIPSEQVGSGPPPGTAFRVDGAPISAGEWPGNVVLRTGDPEPDIEISVQRPDGTIVWISTGGYPVRNPTSGELVAAVATITDITARRRAESELRAVLERALHPVLVHRDLRTVWANTKWAELLGYDDARSLVGVPIAEFVPARVVPYVEEQIRIRTEDAEPVTAEEVLVRRDGTEVPVVICGIPTQFEGRPASIVFARDLTQQRRTETQLVAADRLASLGRLAASIGHEINNPLTYTIGNMQFAAHRLRAGSITTPELLELLDEAIEGADRVRRIVEDLKVFARRQSASQATTDVRSVLESCIRMASAEVRHRARLVQDIDDVPPVRAAEARIAQVISNLLFNAAQAIPEGQASDHTITLSAKRAHDGFVEIRVTDTGIGIAAENLPHVFEPFFTTKLDHGGTGLGLSVCHMLVAEEGGQIDVASVPGKGTCVTVRLLAAGDHVDDREDPLPPAWIAPLRVLIVDDEVPIAEFLRDNLGPHEVTLASSGREAITRIEAGDPFDVIVCDLMMPDLGGMDVYEQVRHSHPGLERRIVFITGGAFTPRTSKFLSEVTNACVPKPFELEALISAIERTAALDRGA
jgi:PAS domain S-box-containing protein